MAKSFVLIVIFSLVVFKASADSFCGIVLAKNGINVRDQPSLDSKIIDDFVKGETFKFYTDGYTERFQEIKDGDQVLKGQWVKIDITSYNAHLKTYEGYIFMTPKYAVEMYDCRAFKSKVVESDLYKGNYDGAYALKREDSLKRFLNLSIYKGAIDSSRSTEVSIIKQPSDFRVLEDTIFLRLADGSFKKIISYPMGQNGDEFYLSIYEYIGYHQKLDSYVLAVSYWESGAYFLVDKTTGQISEELFGIPSVSPSAKYSFEISEEDTDEPSTYLILSKLVHGVIHPIFGYDFCNWLYDDEMIWISDSELLIAVKSIKDDDNWVDEAEENIKYLDQVRKQYIKLKIL